MHQLLVVQTSRTPLTKNVPAIPHWISLTKISQIVELILHFPGNIDIKPKVIYLEKFAVEREDNGYVVCSRVISYVLFC